VLPGRAPGLHLSDDGRRQADAAAKRVAQGQAHRRGLRLAARARAGETALPIARAVGLAVRIERGLLELDIGRWTGERLEPGQQAPGVVPRCSAIPADSGFPDGESFVECRRASPRRWPAWWSAHRGGAVVAVSHADPIKAALAPRARHARWTSSSAWPSRRAPSPPIVYGAGGPTVLGMNALGDAAAS